MSVDDTLLETATIHSVKDYAAIAAQDAASHGYNGREGKAAQLLKECARAVRIAARKVGRASCRERV